MSKKNRNILKQNCREFKDAQQVSRSVTQEYLTLLRQDGSLLKKEPNYMIPTGQAILTLEKRQTLTEIYPQVRAKPKHESLHDIPTGQAILTLE